MPIYTLPPPDELTPDGPDDYTSAITDWLNGTVQAGTPDAYNDACMTLYETYPHKSEIVWERPQYVRLRGMGASLVDSSDVSERTEAHFTIDHGLGVEVKSLTAVGSAPRSVGYESQYEAQHAFQLKSSSHVKLTNCGASDVWGDLIYGGFSRAGDVECFDVQVAGFRGGYSHRHNVSIVAGRQWRFDSGCNFGATGRTCIDLEPNSTRGMAVDVAFDGCNFGTHHNNFLAAASQKGGTIDGVRVTGVTVTGGTLTVVVAGVGQRSNFVLDGCSCDKPAGSNSGAAMSFTGVTGVAVTKNHQPLQAHRVTGLPMRVARFNNCTGVVYAGNTPQDIG